MTISIVAYVFGLVLLYLVGMALLVPLKFVIKLLINGVVGGILLLIVNFIGAFFAFSIAINPVTALIAGFLGVPGVLLLILLQVFV